MPPGDTGMGSRVGLQWVGGLEAKVRAPDPLYAGYPNVAPAGSMSFVGVTLAHGRARGGPGP